MDFDQAKVDAVTAKAAEIRKSGRLPQWLFLCQTGGGSLVLPAPDVGSIMLIFSTHYSATDYMRTCGVNGQVGHFDVARLGELAQSWLQSNVTKAMLDRCPRCTHGNLIDLARAAKWTTEDFATVWSVHRASRVICGQERIQAAIDLMAAGRHADARSSLEYLRDHFDWGVPYLHQMIGLLCSILLDEEGKKNSMERLKEFGPPFEGPLEFSPQLAATVTVGLMMNFGMLPIPADAGQPTSNV